MADRVFKNITVVDDNDTVIGYMGLFEALDKGLMRRVNAVYIFNESGHLLMQKRADWVISPNTWDHSAGGHVDEGSTYKTSAQQELEEELGLRIDLDEVVVSVQHAHMFWGLYKGVISDDTPVPYDPDEVAGVRWVRIDELER